MKYDSIVQFSRMANETEGKGKVVCNILREFFKNIEIKHGTMYKATSDRPCKYCIHAKTTQGEDIEIIRVKDNVSVKVVGPKKKIESNISLNEEIISTSGQILDETGLYIFDGVPQEKDKETGNMPNCDFIASYYDNEVLRYISEYQESPEMIKNGVPGKKSILEAQIMLSNGAKMNNKELRKILLDEGILPDDEIRKEVLMGEDLYLSTSIYKNNPSEFMNENRNEMTR